MKASEQRVAAKRFAERWNGRGDEKSDTQLFWIELLQDVFGVEDISNFIVFEDRVKLEHTSFIDARIPSTKVLIEQKSITRSLTAPYKQSDGSLLTPYQQAKKYIVDMKLSQHPRWVVTCNFKEFYIYDMEKPTGDPLIIKLEDLQDEYYLLQILVEDKHGMQKKEMEVSLQAGELVGVLYEALLNQYADKENEDSLKALNMLCVRLVFCLYAEDAGIFGKRRMFHDYLAQFEAKHLRKALIELFQVLDQKPEERDKYLEPELAQFPYVNGGLFKNEDIEIPMLTEEIKELLLNRASLDFDWSAISPTIFGAVFESTLNPETRRSGGMHYTSIENIHKVIDPLFMDGLKLELEEIKAMAVIKTKEMKLQQFQKKLSELVIFDPACGSGNFLTESYISLRRLENETLMGLLECNKKAFDTQIMLGMGDMSPIQVNISQFYGIEINDFAVSVARTAMWIAESQMMEETAGIVHMDLDFLPLKSYTNIKEGNALRMDWEDVVPKEKLSYIIGNPPFVGYSLQSKEQKSDILSIYVDEKGKPYKTAGKIDYVAGWYFKAAKFMLETKIRTAFVSTNSITQGEQVAAVWKPLYEHFGIHIDFAYRTFVWDSEASMKAHVHVVVIGFSSAENNKPRLLFDSNRMRKVNNINSNLKTTFL